MRVRNKYFAIPTEFNGKKYPSKLEARYASYLDKQQKLGNLAFWLEQVPIQLPGKTTYRLDFMEFWHTDELGTFRIEWVDTKGMKPTESFKIKKRQVEALYPIKISIVEKV